MLNYREYARVADLCRGANLVKYALGQMSQGDESWKVCVLTDVQKNVDDMSRTREGVGGITRAKANVGGITRVKKGE